MTRARPDARVKVKAIDDASRETFESSGNLKEFIGFACRGGALARLLSKVVQWLVIGAMPLMLVLTGARILIDDWYPRMEYAKPDFPPDPYGFSQQQRLEFALVCIHYLQRPEAPEAAIVMLNDLRLPGTEQPLFNRNEISHMVDVKRLTDALWMVWGVSVVLVVGGEILLLARRQSRGEGFQALFLGGLLTSGLLTVLVLFVLLSWSTFFVAFHDVFFPPGTWTFDWSDSLIRLFPDKFWFDAGTILTAVPLAAGLILAAIGYLLKRRAAALQVP